MIIIVAAPKRFPFSKDVNWSNLGSSGLQVPEDRRDDPQEAARIESTHPFLRPQRARAEPPPYMRWMWHPRTGEMLTNTGGQHSEMLANYNRKRKEQGLPTAKFEDWLRGFYVPSTNSLAMRPYYVPETELPFSQFPVQQQQPEREFDPGQYTVNEDMQWHLKNLIEKGTGQKFEPGKNFHTNVDNDWLAKNYGAVGGNRW